MDPDNSFTLKIAQRVPETLHGTRQGLFFLLAQEAKQKTNRQTKQEVALPTTPYRLQASQPQMPRQPEQQRWSDVLSSDDFQFTF